MQETLVSSAFVYFRNTCAGWVFLVVARRPITLPDLLLRLPRNKLARGSVLPNSQASVVLWLLLLIKPERGARKWMCNSPGNQWLTVGILLIKVTLPISAGRRAAGQSRDGRAGGFVFFLVSRQISLYTRERLNKEKTSITVVLQLQEEQHCWKKKRGRSNFVPPANINHGRRNAAITARANGTGIQPQSFFSLHFTMSKSHFGVCFS